MRRGAYVLGEVWAARRARARTAPPDEGGAEVERRTTSPRTRPHSHCTVCPCTGCRLDIVDVQSPVEPHPDCHRGCGPTRGTSRPSPSRAPGRPASSTPSSRSLLRSGLEAALVPLRCRAPREVVHPGRRRVGPRPACAEAPRSAWAGASSQLADPKCDSPGETRTRILLHDLGLSWRSQVVICDENDDFVARVDFLVGGRVVVEFDGLRRTKAPMGGSARAEKRARTASARGSWSWLTGRPRRPSTPPHASSLARFASARIAAS